MVCEPGESILRAVLRTKWYLSHGCRTGGCGTCKSRLVSGDVRMPRTILALTREDRDAGWILPCVSEPLEDCVLDVSVMELTKKQFLAGSTPQMFAAEVDQNVSVAPSIRMIRLRLIEPETIRFVAGQFVSIEIPHTDEVRTYSIASSPLHNNYIDLFVKMRSGGRFSALLENEVLPGAKLRVFGPFGDLRIRWSHRPILMIAGGMGLVPMLSMLSDLVEKEATREVRLFFGVGGMDDFFGFDRIGAIQKLMPDFEFVPAIGHDLHENWAGETGSMSDVLMRQMGSVVDHDAYVCGPPEFIEEVVPLLIREGVRNRNVYRELFTAAVT